MTITHDYDNLWGDQTEDSMGDWDVVSTPKNKPNGAIED